MVIRASSRAQIDTLIADLSAPRAAQRDAAIARLTVIGERAVGRLVAVARDSRAPADARAAALRVLEAIGDPRSLDAAIVALSDPEPIVVGAGVALARGFLHGGKSVTVVDALTALALDTARPAAARIAALQALRTLSAETVAPLLKTLASDPDRDVAAAVNAADAPRRRTTRGVDAASAALMAGRLPDAADDCRRAVAVLGEQLPLPVLHDVIAQVRDREAASSEAARAQWIAARAAAHAALAARGSRLALYDLRESLEAARVPLPVEMLTALAAVGDASCLEPIAAAFTRIDDQWWRRHLADACTAIVERERLTRRHAAVVRADKRWPAAIAELWPTKGKAGRSGRSGRRDGSGRSGG